MKVPNNYWRSSVRSLARSDVTSGAGLRLCSVLLSAIAGSVCAQTAPAEATTATNDEEIVTLSPFEVKSGSDRGYYGANTLSGTRFNAKLADLASAMTVLTKQQMTDFAMLDVNDMFLYVPGTEGTGTYTDYSIDRNGSISDNTQANPTQANRVRGIGSANVSFDNIETMNRVPVDSLEVDAVEVSRGPNANVFGLGNPSGTVNIVPTSANLQRNSAGTNLRADSWGGWRTDLDVNQTIIKDKLAVRASGIFQHDGFDRKPSGVDTERYKGMIKYRPFKKTTITGSVGYYHAYGNRPNTIPPRDNITYWISKGRPYWDPSTNTIYKMDGTPFNGTVANSTFTAATYNGPDVFTSGYLGNNHSQMFIDQSGLVYWSAPAATTNTTILPGATSAGPTALTSSHYLQTTAASGAVFSGTAPRPFSQPLFNTTPTINDQSVYDWSSINISAPNRFWDRTTTYYVKLDQIFLDSPTQTLAAQAAVLREDSTRWARNLLGVSNDNGQSGQLTVDINKTLIDGSPNPFFMRPYIASDKPRTQMNPQKWDSYRGQLSYRLDLSRNDNLLKWLGWFQVTGYDEYKYRVNRQYSWRDGFISTQVPWLPAGLYTGTQSSPSGTPANQPVTSGEYRYYVGDANSVQVKYAPSDFSYGAYPFVWSTRTGSGTAASPFAYTKRTDTIALQQVAADKSGGNLNSKTIIKTSGVVGQSHLFADRLVTTLGFRYDSVFTKFGNPGQPVTNAFLNSDGITFNHAITDSWAATAFKNSGHTTNVQFVLRPFSNTAWTARLDKNGNGGHFLAELFNGLSFYTNRSNNFLPTLPAQDLYRNLLPNTTGTEKSWGLGLSLFNDSLQIRATHYDDIQHDAQTTDINTMAGRVLRVDFSPTGSGSPTPSHNLYTNAQRWVKYINPTWSQDQVNTEVEKQIGFSTADNAYYTNATPPIGATADVRSVGTEIEINYNPTKYWTVAASGTKVEQSNDNISKALVTWINERMPVWTKIVDPSIKDADAIAEGNPGKLWWNHRYTQSGSPPPAGQATYTATAQTPGENYNAFVGAPFAVIKAQEGKASPQVRPYNFRLSTSVQLAGLFENKHLKRMNVGGAVRWEYKAAIGYYGVQQLPAVITDLDPNRPIYDKAHYYFDLFAAYRTKLWKDKVGVTFRINVQNLGETGRLQPVGAFPDGSISTYRIVDPQKFIFTASFDL